MYQFRATDDVIIVLERPWKLNGSVPANTIKSIAPMFPVSYTVRVNYLCLTGGGGGFVNTTVDPTYGEWVLIIPNAGNYRSGLFLFSTAVIEDGTYSSQNGMFEWGYRYEGLCAASDLVATHMANAANQSTIAATIANNRTKLNVAAQRLEIYDDTGLVLLSWWPLKDADGNPTGILGNVYERGKPEVPA